MSQGIVVVPKACVERLPIYYRALVELSERGVGVVSSDELAEYAGVKAFQLRKDLSYFGEFGIRGFGYDVNGLIMQLREILGISRTWKVCIVGAGRLGTALADYPGFGLHGLEIAALFDSSPDLIGQAIGQKGVMVYDVAQMREVITNNEIRIGAITVPANFAQAVAETLIDSGVKGIWNFAPVKLRVPPGIEVYQEDLSVGLLSLTHYLSMGKAKKAKNSE